MEILLVGLNYRSAPVEVRECFSVPDYMLEEALTTLKNLGTIREAVLLSTCNRTEIYAVTSDVSVAVADIEQYLATLSQLGASEFREHLYVKKGLGAIRHLHRVVCGLDSMVVGETQILGQVRGAFLFSQSMSVTGHVFNQLFRQVIAFGKRVQAETEIGQNPVSVSYAAVALAKKVFDNLADRTVLVIGAGKMSELTLTHLVSQGVKRILVVNRSVERAREVAERFGGFHMGLGELEQALRDADIVISSTGAKGYVLSADDVQGVMKRRKQRPLFFIDIAVPRDIDPALSRFDGIYLYDIDDLQDVVASNVAVREREAARVSVMIDEEVASFVEWVSEQRVVPLIAQLRERASSVQEDVMASLTHKLPELDERAVKVLQKHTLSIVNQLLREPIASVKQMALEADGDQSLEMFARIFGLTADSLGIHLETSDSGGVTGTVGQRADAAIAEGRPSVDSEPSPAVDASRDRDEWLPGIPPVAALRAL